MALQMGIVIFAGVFGGYRLDLWLNLKPLFTVLFSLTSVFIAIYMVVRDPNKNKK